MLKDVLQVVSKNHPDWIVGQLEYIRVLTATERLEEAETVCLEILNVIATEKVLCAESPRMRVIAEQLSLIHEKQERWNELESLKVKYPLIDKPGKQQFNIRL